MVGGFVNQEKAALHQEHKGQEHLGLLPLAQGGKGPVEDLFFHLQKGEFPAQSPGFQTRQEILGYAEGPLLGMLYQNCLLYTSMSLYNFAIILTVALQIGASIFTGYLLRRPNASIYFSLMLALCYLEATRKKPVTALTVKNIDNN